MSLLGLTRRQAQALQFIGGYFREHGFSPSYDEIAAHLGVLSKGNVNRIVGALSERGYLIHMAHRQRGLRPTPDGEAYLRQFSSRLSSAEGATP